MTPGPRRHLRVLAWAGGSLRRRWRKNLAVCCVYSAVIFATASVVFLTEALTGMAESTLRSSPEITVQRLAAGRHGLTPVDSAGPLSGIVGVQAVFPRLWAYHSDPGAEGLLLLRVPEEDPPEDAEATAGADLLRRRGIAAGGTLVLADRAGKPLALRIAGTAATASSLESASLVNVSESAFRALTGMPAGMATDLAMRVRNKRETPTIAAKIGSHRPDTRPILRDELLRTYGSVFHRRSGTAIAALLLPVLAFILFAWDKASGLDPEERREIGVMKALGWETGDIILLKSYESVAVSIAAFAAGAGLAVGALSLPHPPAILQALLGWSALYPPFRTASVPDAYQLATLFFLSVVPYLAATIIPAWRAATTDPDLVMRG